METIGKYMLITTDEPSMAVRNFEVSADEKHQAVLKWTWPQDSRVKLMMVFPLEDEDDLKKLLQHRYEHMVISRNLADYAIAPIQGNRQRFLLCPAYFDEENKIVVSRPELISDWVYKVSRINARAVYKPLFLSQYQKVNFEITLSEALPEGALRYEICENNRSLGTYPMDGDLIDGKYSFNIKKSQQVRFLIADEHINRYRIV